MKFAYADPPYLGCGVKHYGDLRPDAADFDSIDAHHELVGRLVADYPDGWALSLHTPSLQAILPACPSDVRVAAWVKPFASFKPNVNPAYAWEPVIWRGGRKRDRSHPTVRDWHSASITLRKGLTGAKPASFARWLLYLWGALPCDELVDLFPGTGGVAGAWDAWRRQKRATQTYLDMGAA